MIETINANCLAEMQAMAANSQDLIFCDPPYALGSDVIIRKDGKPDYRKAVDFMAKWQQPDGYFWEQWFNEAFRVLRYGGRVVMFGMDRQLMLNKYYACFAGFAEQQSLYWFFISSFPKASDLSKMLDRNNGKAPDNSEFRQYLKNGLSNANKTQTDINKLLGTQMAGHYFGNSQPAIPTAEHYKKIKDFLGLCDTWDDYVYTIEAEREVVGKHPNPAGSKGNTFPLGQDVDLTTPATTLAQKYDGMKYSIAPLKQTNETILVFQKPYKTGSCLHDTLAYENGDAECMCGAVDVEGNRCETSETEQLGRHNKVNTSNLRTWENENLKAISTNFDANGRYPAQTYCDDEAAKVLDKQSGVLKSGEKKDTHAINRTLDENGNYESPNGCYGKFKARNVNSPASSGGCSRILHRCNYDLNDYDIYHYCPKVSNKERNEGCEKLNEKQTVQFNTNIGNLRSDGTVIKEAIAQKNHHPTVKPIALLKKIIQLFKTPNPLHVLDPFMGSGSMGIACIELGVSYTGVELDTEYYTIAQTRLAHHNTKNKSKLF